MNKFIELLNRGDLRSIQGAAIAIANVHSQDEFDELFGCLHSTNRKVVMRAADAIEKLTIGHVNYLHKHKGALLAFCQVFTNIEFKWHLALLVTRLQLTDVEFGMVWDILSTWATSRKESKIVRVNSIQGLFSLMHQKPELALDFSHIIKEIEYEEIPSINARIRKIRSSKLWSAIQGGQPIDKN